MSNPPLKAAIIPVTPLQQNCTVVWCTATRGLHQIGVKFGAVDPESRRYLELFMQFLDGGDDESEGS